MTAHDRQQAVRVFRPDGKLLTRANLPTPNTKHWVPHRKAEVVAAVEGGLLSREEACELYSMTVEEFASWQDAVKARGLGALRVKRLNDRRKAAQSAVQEAGAVVLKGEAAISCVIVDISARGARLRFESPVAVPQRFLLRCEKNRRSLWVRLAWRQDCELGVAFDKSVISQHTGEISLDKWLLATFRPATSPSLEVAELVTIRDDSDIGETHRARPGQAG